MRLTTRADKIGAVLLAAGRSVRFRSARSKLLHELGGRPIIQWLLGVLEALDVDPVVVVVPPGADALRRACGRGVRFAVQEQPRGTGHAVLAAEPALAGFGGSVLVVNADLPLLHAETLRRLIDTHRATSGILTLLTATVADPHGWGRIVRKRGVVTGIVEERDATPAQQALREVNVGVYCADARVLFPMLRRVTPDNAQGEIYLTDIVGRAVQAGIQIADATVDAAEVGQINSRRELATMEKMLRSQINAKWMDAGVTFEDPDTAYVGPDVTIGRDTIIGPNVHLRGRTAIGEGCRLEGSAFLTDATLGDRVHVRFGVVMTEAGAGARCQIGPFAHLRPGSRLGEDVHIGDFVETKNAVLGRGTKANHLAYLGDTEIGSETNVGAGTITCNYDGFRKSRTVIGSRVQVGSDSQLVAPVTVGDDAYIATGTCVRRDVPAGTLVFNPREQAHRPGWVAARRTRETAAAPPSPPAKAKSTPAPTKRAKATSKTATKKTTPGGARRRATAAHR